MELDIIFCTLHFCYVALQHDIGSIVEVLEFTSHTFDRLFGFWGYRNQVFHYYRGVEFTDFRQVDLAAGINFLWLKPNNVFRIEQPQPAAADVHDRHLDLASALLFAYWYNATQTLRKREHKPVILAALDATEGERQWQVKGRVALMRYRMNFVNRQLYFDLIKRTNQSDFLAFYNAPIFWHINALLHPKPFIVDIQQGRHDEILCVIIIKCGVQPVFRDVAQYGLNLPRRSDAAFLLLRVGERFNR